MSFGRILKGVFVASGAFVLVAGFIAVFSKDKSLVRTPKNPRPTSDTPRTDYFEIRRTKSELGYVYWILKGYGAFQCFDLFDTWQEAAGEAQRRSQAALLK